MAYQRLKETQFVGHWRAVCNLENNMRKMLMAVAMTLGAATPALAVPVQWGSTGHYYELVIDDAKSTQADAIAAAASRTFNGLTGYLATITSAAEQTFLNTVVFREVLKEGWEMVYAGWEEDEWGGYPLYEYVPYSYTTTEMTTAWLGASDEGNEGVWTWLTGPEAGTTLNYSNWAPGEPNNWSGNENFLVGWWDHNTGWNDLYDGQGSYAYLVEYGDSVPAAVPLPATGLLLLGALGGLGLRRKRRSV